MENKIPKDTLSLLLSTTSKSESLLLGKKIGERIAEDFFSRNSLNAKIKIQNVPENISLFFTTYFSYTPQIESNLISLEGFYGTKYSKEGINVFKGIFEVIYKYLCEEAVEIVVDGNVLLVKPK